MIRDCFPLFGVKEYLMLQERTIISVKDLAGHSIKVVQRFDTFHILYLNSEDVFVSYDNIVYKNLRDALEVFRAASSNYNAIIKKLREDLQ